MMYSKSWVYKRVCIAIGDAVSMAQSNVKQMLLTIFEIELQTERNQNLR